MSDDNKIIITNFTQVTLADSRVLGAAVKALAVGGLSIGEPKIQELSGLSNFVWERDRAKVLDLIFDLTN